jgi:hypothetical protein
MRERRELARSRVRRLDMKVARLPNGLRVRIGIGEQKARKAPSERRLADALPAAYQPGMGKTVVAIGGEELRLRGLVANESQENPPVRPASSRVRDGVRRIEPRFDSRPDGGGDVVPGF